MPHNPSLNNRRSIRLKGYDYSQAGLYFITININKKIKKINIMKYHKLETNLSKIEYFAEW